MKRKIHFTATYPNYEFEGELKSENSFFFLFNFCNFFVPFYAKLFGTALLAIAFGLQLLPVNSAGGG